MLDFVRIKKKRLNKNTVEVKPQFIVHNRGKQVSDVMIKGGKFYAVWCEDEGLWSTSETKALVQIDEMVERELKNVKRDLESEGSTAIPLYSWDADSGVVDKWHKFCEKQLSDNFHPLDNKIMFSNDEIKKEDYASKSLDYPLKKGPTKNWNALMSVLYSPEELRKLEWSIGAIVTGDSRWIQKFIVLYGAMGTGKSTFLKIVEKLFDGYHSSFDAKSLGSQNAQFALEQFKNNPLIAIQHDGDLSRIEDNTRLNSIVSHEELSVNEKNKSLYSASFHSFLYMGTNTPVKITDAKSGILRRLIDVSPTGNKVKRKDYDDLMAGIEYEKGAICFKCRELYLSDPHFYDSYVPVSMMSTTNDFYDYILENTDLFEEQDYTTLKQAWKLYLDYCNEANVPYPYKRIKFKDELKNYFEEYDERKSIGGTQIRNVYSKFIIDKFKTVDIKTEDIKKYVLVLDHRTSLLDDVLKDSPAQYATDAGKPTSKWSRIRRTLKDIDTSKLHYVKVPKNHIVIDFDLKDPETGEKDYELNLMAASKFPPTYAELSKSGAGIHLHYIYDGDVNELSSVYAPGIEIKVFKGDSSLRRMVTLCNALAIATISSGLPLRQKKGGKMVDFDGVQNEKGIRTQIIGNLNKEYHDNTTQSMNFIKHILDEAYASGITYDVSDLRGPVLAFASNSSNQKKYCMGLIPELHWRSVDKEEEFMNAPTKEPNLIFLDIEVAPNLLLICWKPPGDKPCVQMFNPSPAEIEKLMEFDWVGHNVRKYDNHIIYARYMGFPIPKCYEVSKRIIIDKDKNAFFPSAYRAHYADTLDYPVKKQGLKKWEIELGQPHKEMDVDWTKPIPENMWEKLAEYCENDVRATEAVWNATQTDFAARKMMASISDGEINDTTNQLSTKFMFGNNKKPQGDFRYRNMGDESTIDEAMTKKLLSGFKYKLYFPEFTKFTKNGEPVFPGYTFVKNKSDYRGENPKEGGYVYSEPGIYGNVALLDIASMHPSSVIAENLFGDEYTAHFKSVVDARLAIKHKEFDKVKKMFGGKLAPYVGDEDKAKDLANALKIVINSVYGLTSAKFENAFMDPRNKDNIVAKRGSLFMINLKHEVQARGFKVAHIKTDSIKIPDATPEIIDFVMEYGKLYGYSFEHEATYERLCLVDKANYVCRDASDGHWSVTGDKFTKPNYIFKTLFTHEDIEFKDVCEMKAVTSCIYIDHNEGLPDVTAEEKELKKLEGKYKKGEVSDTTFESESKQLREVIKTGHDYHFVGKVGNFAPVLDGCGGGYLVRKNDRTGRYDAVNGSKGTRWLEAEDIKAYGLEDQINYGYFDEKINELRDDVAKNCINGDFEWFLSDDPYIGCEYDKNGIPIYEDSVPFDED